MATLRWSTGMKWEVSTQAEPSLWGALDPSVAYPSVILNNIDICDRVASINWGMGRGSLLDSPEPGTAQFDVVGDIVAHPGDPVRIEALPIGVLWRGQVDNATKSIEPDGTTTHITCVDAWAKMLAAEIRVATTIAAAGDLAERLQQLATVAGVAAPSIRIAPSVGVLPPLLAITGTASIAPLAQHLDDSERASNAITSQQPDGSWAILPRDALPTGTFPIADLLGPNCPESMEVAESSADHIKNSFAVNGVLTNRTTSINKYGLRTYEVKAGFATTPPYTAGFFDAVSQPVPFAEAVVPILARSTIPLVSDPVFGSVPLRPFDFVREPINGTIYQVLGMEWDAAPDDWGVSLVLDRTQNSIAAVVTPPPDVIPPPVVHTITETFLCDRDAYVVHTSGGSNTGNGASDDILVGLTNDGHLSRGLLRFALGFNGKVSRVVSATLRLHVGEDTCASFGSSPGIKVWRLTAGWSEGTYAVRCGFATANAVVYPGPVATSTGAVVRSVSRTTGAICDVNVLDIVKSWAAGSPNYGVRLTSVSESSTADRTVLWGRGAGSASLRPQLIVTYEYT